jgi:hypothetical protein
LEQQSPRKLLSNRWKAVIHLILIASGVVILWFGFSGYREAESHLTPKSVSVRGYHRRDGTYVAPYNRRPPGGAIHDRPYENQMFWYSLLMVMGGGLVIIPIGMMARTKMRNRSQGFEKLQEKVRAYRDVVKEEIELDNALISTCWQKVGEGHGASGLLICAYADVIARATIENYRSRNESELPSSPEKIKAAIIEVAELIITKPENDSALEILKMLYTSLARFLPEPQAIVATECNRGRFSADPNHPGLRKSEEAQQVEAGVEAEEDRLAQEFDDITLELLESELAKATRERDGAERELLEFIDELNHDHTDLTK